MSQYFGGAPNAWAGGMAYAQEERKRRHEENALQSMIQEYGVNAADPTRWGQVEGIQQRQQLHPYVMAQTQRADTAQRAGVAALGPMAGDPQVFGMNKQHEGEQRTLQMQAGQNLAAYLKRAKASGRDIGGAFDQVAGILPHLGVPVESMQQIREYLVQNPDNVDEFVAMMQNIAGTAGANRAMSGGVPMYNKNTGEMQLVIPLADGSVRAVEGYTPARETIAEGRLGVARGNLGARRHALSLEEMRMRGLDAPPGYEAWIDEDTGVVSMAPVRNTGQAQEFETNLRQADQDDASYATRAQVFNRRAETLNTATSRALEYFGSANGGMFLQNIRRGARFTPGTDAYNAWAALEEIKNNLAMDELDAMRQSSVNGSSGFGQLTERELELLKNSRGLLETTHDPAILASTLRRIQEQVRSMQGIVQADAAAAAQRREQRQGQYGSELRAPSAPGRAPAAPPAAAPARSATPTPQTQQSIQDLVNKWNR